MQGEFFAAVVDNRFTKPKSYNLRKLERLKGYYGKKLKLDPDACRLKASVEQAGRTINWVFYLR